MLTSAVVKLFNGATGLTVVGKIIKKTILTTIYGDSNFVNLSLKYSKLIYAISTWHLVYCSNTFVHYGGVCKMYFLITIFSYILG